MIVQERDQLLCVGHERVLSISSNDIQYIVPFIPPHIEQLVHNGHGVSTMNET